MDPDRVADAASLLFKARRELSFIDPLPESCSPRSVTEAHAVQDEVTRLLGAGVAGFKANAPARTMPDEQWTGSPATNAPWLMTEGVRAPIYAPTVFTSPIRISAGVAPRRGVEGEVAFQFRHDLPPRPEAYSRDEVAAAVQACAAIELVSSRFADPDAATFLDRLADCVSNAGFVHGALVEDWRGLRFNTIQVELTVNGVAVVDQAGGHPTGDPLGIAVALVEMVRSLGGVKAGQFVTCGSYTGLRYLNPGDVCGVRFAGLGSAEVAFINP